MGGSLVGVGNGIAFFRGLNFKIQSLKFGENRVFLRKLRDF